MQPPSEKYCQLGLLVYFAMYILMCNIDVYMEIILYCITIFNLSCLSFIRSYSPYNRRSESPYDRDRRQRSLLRLVSAQQIVGRDHYSGLYLLNRSQVEVITQVSICSTDCRQRSLLRSVSASLNNWSVSTLQSQYTNMYTYLYY